MVILLVLTQLADGGAERVVSLLANRLCDKGHVVHLLLMSNGPRFYSLDKRVIVHILDKKRVRGVLPRTIELLTTVTKMRKVFCLVRPDAVVASLFKPICYSLFTGLFTNTPVISYIHNDPRSEVKIIRKFLMRIIYPFSRRIVVLNAEIKDFLLNYVRRLRSETIIVVGNPIDERILHDDPSLDDNFQVFTGESYIVSMGRFNPVKGFDKLIAAFSVFHKECPDCKLVILGDGELRPALQQQIYALNLNTEVLLPGFIKSPKEILAKAKFFVLTSNYEGFGNVLIEALSQGTPCISFDCDSGPRHIIQNGVNGYLVELGNVDKLAATMIRLYNDNDALSKLSKQALNIVNDFSEHDFVQKWEDILSALDS